MTKYRIVHDFDTDPETYWKIFFHEPYNVELWQRLRAKERKILDWKETDKTIYREIKIVPERDLPSVIKKVVKGDLGYVEKSTFYRDKNSMDVSVKPTVFADRTEIEARYYLEVLGDKKVRRVFEGFIDVNMPLIGGKVEKVVIDDMTRTYDVATQVTREWIEKGI